MRKLEYFEDELNASASGREILGVIRLHVDEVNHLVNHNRAVMVAWQRNHGPSFLASAMDSGFNDRTPIRKEIDGVTLERLLLRIADALQQSGSRGLVDTVGRYASPVLLAAKGCASISDLFSRIRAGALAGGVP